MNSGPEGQSLPDGEADGVSRLPAARRRAARAVLLAMAGACALGLALGHALDPSAVILYWQLAFLIVSIFIIVRIRRSTVVFPVFLAYLAAYALHRPSLAAALGGLFFVLLLGRGFLGGLMHRTAFTVFAFALAALGFFSYFVWSRTSAVPDRSPQDRLADVAAMGSLPYESFVEDEQHGDKNGVVVFNRRAVAAGLNLYNSYYQAGATLLDMDGRRLHTWLPPGSNPQWHFVALCDNGDLLVCIEDTMLMRLDWNSRVVWQRPLRAHHEIAVAPGGDIYTLISEDETVVLDGVPIPIIDDDIVILGGDGAVKRKISVFGLLKDKLPAATIARIYGRIMDPRDFLWKAIKRKAAGRSAMDRLSAFDVFHDNTITLADRDVPGVCRRGDLLISANALNLIGVVDVERGAMRWTWGAGELQGQHDPTFLGNGNVLVFDNGTERDYSRLIEFDPRTRTIVWEYHSLHPTPLFTSWGGAAQRLANGNTLVTESDAGRVFEITRDGQVVWEFFNPTKGADGKRSTIYRMTRITDPALRSLLMKNVKAES